MRSVFLTVKAVSNMLTRGGTRVLLVKLCRRVYSLDRSYCLRKDLSSPFDIPQTQISIRVEPLQEGHSREIAREHPDLLPLLNAGIPTGYVAVTQQGDICYMQWLFTSEVNEDMRQRHLVGRTHLHLEPDEVLLENAYTFKRYRGLGIMPSVSLQLAEKARTSGARWALTFVRDDNIPALKGFEMAGFVPWRMRQIRWRLFRRQVTYESTSPAIHDAFDLVTAQQSPPQAVTVTQETGSDVRGQIEGFVRTHFHVNPADPHFDRNADLFEDGYVDSIGVIELLAFLEGEFGVEVPEDDLLSDDFSSISGIAEIVERALSTQEVSASA